MFRRVLLPICIFVSLNGCDAQSQHLPKSEKLSPEKVEGISERINDRYPELSGKLREQILTTVVRSLDDMVFIGGGEFEMGDFGTLCQYDPANMGAWPYGQEPERLCPITPERHDDYLHQVRLSSYHLSRYQTRLEDFDLFRTSLGLELFDAELREREDLQFRYRPANPAPTQSWQEAEDYCQWLNKLSGYSVDLPTEAQWEYAARSRGKYFQYPTDNGSLEQGRNILHDGEHYARPIGQFPPNPLGLYDMTGNATDWVSDWYSEDYYMHSLAEDPQGPPTGTQKIRRGTDYGQTLWIGASTVQRWNYDLKQSRYFPSASFRCAVQSTQPL